MSSKSTAQSHSIAIRGARTLGYIGVLSTMLLGLGSLAWMCIIDVQIHHSKIESGLREAGASPALIEHTITAVRCAQRSWNPAVHPMRLGLGVVDLERPANQKRFWLIDMATGEVKEHGLMAHGVGSGTGRMARTFSNRSGTNMSSLGLYQVFHQYWSDNTQRHNTSLRGLDPGFNDQAKNRGVLLHPAHRNDSPDYVTATRVTGQSHGCIALSRDHYAKATNALQWGGLLFQYADAESDGRSFLEEAWSVNCGE